MLLSLLSGHLARPSKILPSEVQKHMTSPYTAEMHQRSQDMLDPTSGLMQNAYAQLSRNAADQAATANRQSRQNMAMSGMGGQSGLIQQAALNNTNTAYGGLQDQMTKMMNANIGASNSLLSGAANNDMQVRDAMASAYGQNITNKNNWRASMAGNFMKGGGQAVDTGIMALAAGMFSDKTMKKNIKKIGKAKTKDGKSVNIYRFKMKGSDKSQTGVIAQEIQKSHPKAVSKASNGKLKVNYGMLF